MYIYHQLQQFRQKKDKGSGSHGKSTKKSGKSEQHEADADADAVNTATKPTALSQVREGATESPEGSNSDIVNTSVSNSAESDTSVAVVGPSAVPITHEKNVVEIELEKNTESSSEEVGVSKPEVDSSIQNEGESTGTADAEVARYILLDTSHIVDSGGEAENSNMSIQDDVSAQHASADITEGMLVTIQSEIPRREKESLPSWENINTSLMQEREDQVTDVGCALLLLLFNFLYALKKINQGN